MTAKEQAYKVCVVARKYPASWFWLFACGALAAGIEGETWILGVILFGQLWIVAHTVHRMWSPPIWEATTVRGGKHVRQDG
jgi:hypothetical protein